MDLDEKVYKKHLEQYIHGDPCPDGSTIMIAALCSKCEELCKLIAENYYFEVNSQLKKDGSTAFALALKNKYWDVAAEILEDKKFDINLTNEDNMDALMLSCFYDREELAMKILRRSDVIVTRQDTLDLENAFMFASDNGMEEVCQNIFDKMLEDPDASTILKQEDNDGYNILDYAFKNCSNEIFVSDVYSSFTVLDLIVEKENKVTYNSCKKETAMVVHLCKWYSLLENFVNIDTNLNVYDDEGRPILCHVIQEYHEAKEKKLHENIIFNLKNSLIFLIKAGTFDMFEAKDKAGANAIMYAIKYNCFPKIIIKRVLSYSLTSDYDIDDDGHGTAYTTVLRALDNNNSTPLNYAVLFNNEESFDMLINHYDSISVVNKFGKTVFTYACNSLNEHYLETLMESFKGDISKELKQFSGLMGLSCALCSANEEIKKMGKSLLLL